MKLTQENAHKYFGKKVDAETPEKRHFHYYPLEVTRFKNSDDDRYIIKDSVGVCQIIPSERDTHNSIYFERIVENA